MVPDISFSWFLSYSLFLFSFLLISFRVPLILLLVFLFFLVFG